MTLGQIRFAVIPKVDHKQHVLIHLLLGKVGHGSERILKRLFPDLLEATPLSALGLNLPETVKDVSAGVVIRRGEDALAQDGVAVGEDRFDELARVVGGIEERDGRALWAGVCEDV